MNTNNSASYTGAGKARENRNCGAPWEGAVHTYGNSASLPEFQTHLHRTRSDVQGGGGEGKQLWCHLCLLKQ